jgi:hypothetical protein
MSEDAFWDQDEEEFDLENEPDLIPVAEQANLLANIVQEARNKIVSAIASRPALADLDQADPRLSALLAGYELLKKANNALADAQSKFMEATRDA